MTTEEMKLTVQGGSNVVTGAVIKGAVVGSVYGWAILKGVWLGVVQGVREVKKPQ